MNNGITAGHSANARLAPTHCRRWIAELETALGIHRRSAEMVEKVMF
jgi:hypothetical protein